MLLTRPLSIACVAALIHPVIAAAPEPGHLDPVSINVTKRVTGKPHHFDGTDKIDYESVSSHIRGIKVSGLRPDSLRLWLIPPQCTSLTLSSLCSSMLPAEQVRQDESQSRRLYGRIQASFHLAHPTQGRCESLEGYRHRHLRFHRLAVTDRLTLYPYSIQGAGSYWSGVVKFGGQSQRVDFDTGSGDCLLDRNAYTPSSSAINTHKKFYEGYGTAAKDDSFVGTIYQDTFSSGKLRLSNASLGRE